MEKWTEALQRGGVNLDADQQIADFGDPIGERGATQAGEIIADLSQFGLIEERGGDA